MASTSTPFRSFLTQLEDLLLHAIENAEILSSEETGIRLSRIGNEDMPHNEKALKITLPDKYHPIKVLLKKFNLIEDMESKDDVVITEERLKATLLTMGDEIASFQKLKEELIPKINECLPQLSALRQIRLFANLLGVNDVLGFTYKPGDKKKFEGNLHFNSFNFLANEFTSYINNATPTIEQKKMSFLRPIVEGFERYSPKNLLTEFPEGLTPLPLSYDIDTSKQESEVLSHAVSLGILRKGKNYFLVYTNAVDSLEHPPGTYTFQIAAEKMADLLNPYPEQGKEFSTITNLYRSLSRLWDENSKSIRLWDIKELTDFLQLFFLTDKQMKLFKGKTIISDYSEIDKTNYAIDEVKAIYHYSQPQKHQNCTISSNRKQMKGYINFYLTSHDNKEVTYETLKTQLKNKEVRDDTQRIYKKFTQEFLRDNAIKKLVEFIKEVYHSPKKFGNEDKVNEIKKTLQQLVALYTIQHANQPKDRVRISMLFEKLKHKDLEGFLERVNFEKANFLFLYRTEPLKQKDDKKLEILTEKKETHTSATVQTPPLEQTKQIKIAESKGEFDKKEKHQTSKKNNNIQSKEEMVVFISNTKNWIAAVIEDKKNSEFEIKQINELNKFIETNIEPILKSGNPVDITPLKVKINEIYKQMIKETYKNTMKARQKSKFTFFGLFPSPECKPSLEYQPSSAWTLINFIYQSLQDTPPAKVKIKLAR